MLIRVHHSYDLVLKFDSDFLRSAFIKAFEKFISEITTTGDLARLVQMTTNTTHAALLKQAITKKQRQKKLEMFFRVVFAQVYISLFPLPFYNYSRIYLNNILLN